MEYIHKSLYYMEPAGGIGRRIQLANKTVSKVFFMKNSLEDGTPACTSYIFAILVSNKGTSLF